jgi:hypothetical protein
MEILPTVHINDFQVADVGLKLSPDKRLLTVSTTGVITERLSVNSVRVDLGA